MKGRNDTMKKYNRTLLVALLIVAVFATAIGGTFAWFTDSEESTGNVIKSGTLDLGFTWAEHGSDEYKDASTGAIFDYKYWEPGYVQVRDVKIANLGDLAFKYQLNVKEDVASSGEYQLAKVIDVYTFPAGTTVDRDVIASTAPVGTIADLMGDIDGAAHGVLLPAEGVGSTDVNEDDTSPRGEVGMIIALKMQESAGNEYQNLSIGGDGFVLELLATQYTWENDDFDHTYDGEADYDNDLPKADIIVNNTNPDFTLYNLASFQPVGKDLKADVAYLFKATETAEEAAAGPYGDWHADYVITVDKEIKAESAGLVGGYGSYGSLGFLIPQDAVPGVEYRLLKDVSGRGIQFSYESICSDVGEFMCGVFNLDEQNVGTKLTVELRLYELQGDTMNNENNEDETGHYVVAARTVYALETPLQYNLDVMAQ